MFHFLSKKLVQIAIIILLTTLAYSNIFQNDFVSDDRNFILTWAASKKISDIPAVIAGDSAPSKKDRNDNLATYRPVRDTLYVIYDKIFGENLLGWHLHSLLVHLGVTILVYLIVEQIIKRISLENERGNTAVWMPFVGALMFGLHPIHTEAITFMTSSMDMIGPLFMFGSFWLYLLCRHHGVATTTRGSAEQILRFSPASLDAGLRISKLDSIASLQNDKRGLYAASVVFALLAFFSYELTLVLPILLIMTDWMLVKSQKSAVKSQLLSYIPYFAIAGFYMFVRIFLIGRLPTITYRFIDNSSFNWSRFMEPEIILKYLQVLFFPINLSFNHMIRPGFDTFLVWVNDPGIFDNYSLWPVFGALFLILVILILALRLGKKFPILTFGVLWFFVSMLPFANILRQPTIMAERYLYIASFGFLLVILFVWSLIPRVIGIILMFFLLIFWGTLTYSRNKDWKDGLTLWKSVIEVYPKSALAYNNVGKEYFDKNDYKSAVPYFRRSVELRPSYYYASYDLARCYYNLESFDLAEDQYKKTIQLNENYVFSYLGLSQIYRKQKRYDLAIATLEKALTIKRENVTITEDDFMIAQSDIYNITGLIYQEQGRVDKALNAFTVALKFDSHSSSASNNLRELVLDNPSLWKQRNTEFGSFLYPPLWEIQEEREKHILTSEDRYFRVEIGVQGFKGSVKDYLSKQEDKYGKLIMEPSTNYPNFDRTYVKVWKDGEIPKLLLILFKDNVAVEIVAYPPERSQKEIFDEVVSSIEISD